MAWRDNEFVAMSFRELENDTTRLYEEGRYRAALDCLDAESDNFTALGHRCKIVYFRACLLAKDGEPDAALDVLETGLVVVRVDAGRSRSGLVPR